jgi:DNA-binding NarL/FixJ family response regulator
VARIRTQRRDARIVVVTDSPTWSRSREAFEAGATDYIRKLLDKEDILSQIKIALAKVLPPWSPGRHLDIGGDA